MSHRQEVTHNGQVHPVRSEAVTERSCHDSLVKAILPNTGSCDCKTPELVNFAPHGTFGILDSGATKSVVGSALLPALLEGLHPDVRQRARRCSCNITFRFGNQGTLDSQHALVIPIGQLGLKIAIVPGQTPLLLSNTLMRTLQSQVDTERHQLRSRFLKHPIKLHLNPKGLFLIDINELVLASAKTGPTAAETFMNDTVEDSTSEPPISQKPNDAADPFDRNHPQGIHEPVDGKEESALPYPEIPKSQPQLHPSAPELSTAVAAGNSQATDCNKVDHATDRCDWTNSRRCLWIRWRKRPWPLDKLIEAAPSRRCGTINSLGSSGSFAPTSHRTRSNTRSWSSSPLWWLREWNSRPGHQPSRCLWSQRPRQSRQPKPRARQCRNRGHRTCIQACRTPTRKIWNPGNTRSRTIPRKRTSRCCRAEWAMWRMPSRRSCNTCDRAVRGRSFIMHAWTHESRWSRPGIWSRRSFFHQPTTVPKEIQ